MKNCVILAGGDICGRVEIPEDALVICADCGYRYAAEHGIVPDILLGDFDSWTETLPEAVEQIRFPVEKDETDTVLAVYCGRDRGCTEFFLYGVFGGTRPEHSVANIQLLYHMALQGLHGQLIHGDTRVTVQLPSTVRYPQYEGHFSVFSLTERTEGLTMKGVYYPVENGVLENTFPLGVSNHITEPYAEVSFAKGALLVMQTEEPKS